jgi:hypothetical protein
MPTRPGLDPAASESGEAVPWLDVVVGKEPFVDVDKARVAFGHRADLRKEIDHRALSAP